MRWEVHVKGKGRERPGEKGWEVEVGGGGGEEGWDER